MTHDVIILYVLLAMCFGPMFMMICMDIYENRARKKKRYYRYIKRKVKSSRDV